MLNVWSIVFVCFGYLVVYSMSAAPPQRQFRRRGANHSLLLPGRRQIGNGAVGGDVALAGSLDILERCSYTVAGCKAAFDVGPHQPVNFNKVSLCVQSRQETGRREIIPQKEYSISRYAFIARKLQYYSIICFLHARRLALHR